MTVCIYRYIHNTALYYCIDVSERYLTLAGIRSSNRSALSQNITLTMLSRLMYICMAFDVNTVTQFSDCQVILFSELKFMLS